MKGILPFILAVVLMIEKVKGFPSFPTKTSFTWKGKVFASIFVHCNIILNTIFISASNCLSFYTSKIRNNKQINGSYVALPEFTLVVQWVSSLFLACKL